MCAAVQRTGFKQQRVDLDVAQAQTEGLVAHLTPAIIGQPRRYRSAATRKVCNHRAVMAHARLNR
jgi:hypothetical protein